MLCIAPDVKEYGDVRPLDKLEIGLIDANRSQLSEGVLLDSSILAPLFEKNAITSAHEQSIESEVTNMKKVRQLLDILRVRSAGAFQEFRCALLSIPAYKELARRVFVEKAGLW